MRFIAQMQIYNMGNFERLRTYLEDNYAPSAFEKVSLNEQLQQWQDSYATHGRFRVKELIAADKHRVVLILQGEHTEQLVYNRVKVSDDYPHLVTQYVHRLHGQTA